MFLLKYFETAASKTLERIREIVFSKVHFLQNSTTIVCRVLLNKSFHYTYLFEIFKTARKVSLVESLFSEAKEKLSAFYNSIRNCIMCIVIFIKLAPLGILRNILLNKVAGCKLLVARLLKINSSPNFC